MAKLSLGIWMNGKRVGTWSRARGTHTLQYDPAWVVSPEGRALSLSLPCQAQGRRLRSDPEGTA